ncbi:vWA domain-containing protein [Streptomyces cacaoi]|uniref:VWFA domain-containing protein n=2 Tax=Streptomyces cacaoi TaxID=1898 RepID=A0A4Y3QSX0_STRCI|nr:vWA domain-containing protein [Streptomyces cacaoi]GEB47498.1 hypothetical protein SCA03_00490 [Streptomyces cacaoi]
MAPYDPRGRRNRALLVGVPRYDNHAGDVEGGVPGNLLAVRHNLAQLRQALAGGNVFTAAQICDFRPHGVDDLGEQLDDAARSAEGLLLFYFAGHGAVPNSGDELWLQTPPARTIPGAGSVFPGALSFSHVLGVLSTSRAEHIVIVLDCCFAGNAALVLEAHERNQRFSLLAGVQANHRVDAGGPDSPTPFTRELVDVLTHGVRDAHGPSPGAEVSFRTLAAELSQRMPRRHTTLRKAPWEPRTWLGTPDRDVLLATDRPLPPAAGRAPADARPGRRFRGAVAVWPGRLWRRARGLPRGLAARAGRRTPRYTAVLLTGAAVVAALAVGAGLLLARTGEAGACSPPLELRVLTDPDLEPTVRRAADAFLTSDGNLTDAGCRRSGISVHAAKASDTVRAFGEMSRAWQEPSGRDDFDPQRDVGPQPDVWIPGSAADVDRARRGTAPQAASFGRVSEPLARSPVVLAFPEDRAPAPERRTGPLAQLLEAPPADGGTSERTEVRRPDPEFTDAALLATVALYGGGADGGSGEPPARAERRIAQPGPPSRTGRALMCALPQDGGADARTAVLVPEHLLRTATDCSATTRERRVAAYPDDVPALAPVLVPVHWDHADRDRAERDAAIRRFEDWFTGRGGARVLRQDGFRPPPGGDRDGGRAPAPGTLRRPVPPSASPDAAALDTALRGYRSANGPGRVLYLLDSSGSMGDLWEGPGGAPGILKQSLSALGTKDRFGVWAVSTAPGGDRPYRELLSFGSHTRAEGAEALDRARVTDHEAEPDRALEAAVRELADRGRDDDHPQAVVYLTDGEDNGRLTDDARLRGLEQAVEDEGVPLVVATLDQTGCAPGEPDARLAAAGGGRCLDPGGSTDLAARLRDEVARTGSGETG